MPLRGSSRRVESPGFLGLAAPGKRHPWPHRPRAGRRGGPRAGTL